MIQIILFALDHPKPVEVEPYPVPILIAGACDDRRDRGDIDGGKKCEI
jgi:hypothetical protein